MLDANIKLLLWRVLCEWAKLPLWNNILIAVGINEGLNKHLWINFRNNKIKSKIQYKFKKHCKGLSPSKSQQYIEDEYYWKDHANYEKQSISP